MNIEIGQGTNAGQILCELGHTEYSQHVHNVYYTLKSCTSSSISTVFPFYIVGKTEDYTIIDSFIEEMPFHEHWDRSIAYSNAIHLSHCGVTQYPTEIAKDLIVLIENRDNFVGWLEIDIIKRVKDGEFEFKKNSGFERFL